MGEGDSTAATPSSSLFPASIEGHTVDNLCAVQCPHCAMEFSVAAEHIGSKFQCIACFAIFRTVRQLADQTIVETVQGENLLSNSKSVRGSTSHEVLNPTSTESPPRNTLGLDDTDIARLENTYLTREEMLLVKSKEAVSNPLYLTKPIVQKILRYLKDHYPNSSRDTIRSPKVDFRATGSKHDLIGRIKWFVASPVYQMWRNRLGKSAKTTSSSAVNTTPYHDPKEGDWITTIRCPHCLAGHSITFISSGAYFKCSTCSQLFAVSMSQLPTRYNSQSTSNSPLNDTTDTRNPKELDGAGESLWWETDVQERLMGLGITAERAIQCLRGCHWDVSVAACEANDTVNIAALKAFCTPSDGLPNVQVSKVAGQGLQEYQKSVLLHPQYGSVSFQQFCIFLHDGNATYDSNRQYLSSILCKMLTLERILIHRYFDCARAYMKNVARRLDCMVVVQPDTEETSWTSSIGHAVYQNYFPAKSTMIKTIFELPLGPYMQELDTLTSLVYDNHRWEGDIPPLLLEHYIEHDPRLYPNNKPLQH